ncbi:MAG: winged helix DNA-binding domain-containing protein [Gammaproteobacteria bacterium]|nr:winged helix DNA-binding domain-containing protein [Gammaproteobacteria bacterium]
MLWFRARRSHLAGPGAPDAATAATAILGAQSQQLSPALLALSQRTESRPTAAELDKALVESPRSLVRAWGQRGTVHVYAARMDWPLVIAARGTWNDVMRRGEMPSKAAVDAAWRALLKSDKPLTRRDIEPLVPASYVKAIEDRVNAFGMDPLRFAAGRLLWSLVLRGDACFGLKFGSEQGYAARQNWFPELDWPDLAAQDAATELARRYLGTYGPATAQDLAHFFTAKVSTARGWLDVLGGRDLLATIECGDKKDLVALREDVEDLLAVPPGKSSEWPLRLLPLWDCLLMGHADKSWTVPEQADQKRVWRKSAVVAAVALDRGRVVANWTQTVKRRRLFIEVEPLTRWRKSRHLSQVRREANAVAAHLGLEGVDVNVTG